MRFRGATHQAVLRHQSGLMHLTPLAFWCILVLIRFRSIRFSVRVPLDQSVHPLDHFLGEQLADQLLVRVLGHIVGKVAFSWPPLRHIPSTSFL